MKTKILFINIFLILSCNPFNSEKKSCSDEYWSGTRDSSYLFNEKWLHYENGTSKVIYIEADGNVKYGYKITNYLCPNSTDTCWYSIDNYVISSVSDFFHQTDSTNFNLWETNGGVIKSFIKFNRITFDSLSYEETYDTTKSGCIINYRKTNKILIQGFR